MSPDVDTYVFPFTNYQFATVEEQAKSDIAEARRERDDAVSALHEIQLQEKEWHRRVDGWKTSVSPASSVLRAEVDRLHAVG